MLTWISGLEGAAGKCIRFLNLAFCTSSRRTQKAAKTGAGNAGDGNSTLEKIRSELRKELCLPNLQAPGSWKLKLLWTKEAAQKSPFSAQHAQGFSLKCIKDQKVPIGVTVVVAALLLTIIALAVKKCPSYPSCPSHVLPSCLNNGIGYGEKCFYFIEDKAEWNKSRIACVSLGAHLATIDSWEELRFLLRYGRSLHYWLGLQREESGPWKWVNGSLFNNWFDVRGKGQCAYINQDGISSDWCSQTKFSVCSHRQNRPSAIQKDSETLPNFT
ncbi:hypothetical protein Q9233_000481 [Columba guinea]|nr:hypothetical protein Q9233_000481 [Columba guinea]